MVRTVKSLLHASFVSSWVQRSLRETASCNDSLLMELEPVRLHKIKN